MYVVIVYDVQQKRIPKVLKIARKYLSWVQNSVLEGEVTPGQYEKLIHEMKSAMDMEQDSLIVYQSPSFQYITRKEWGISKGNSSQWII